MNIQNIKNKLLLALLCAGLAGNTSAANVLASDSAWGEPAQIQEELETANSVFLDFQDSSGQPGGKQSASDEPEEGNLPPVTDGTETGGWDSGRLPSGEAGTEKPGANSQETEPPVTEAPKPTPEDTPVPGPEPSDPDDLPIDGSGIIISRDEMKKAIKAGEEFPVVVFVKNTYKKTKLENIKLQFGLPQGISMNADQKTDTFDVKDIEPGQERKVKVKLISGSLQNGIPTLTMTVKMTYRYEEEGQVKSGQLEKNILLPVSGDKGNPEDQPEGNEEAGGTYGGGYSGGSDGGEGSKKQIDPMTPNIIISQYDYGKDVKAGEEFTLKLVFLNTNKQTAVENLVMTVEAGEALSIEDSSNTTYVERMSPRETFAKEMQLKVLPQGQAENAKLEINFKYEYLKKDERVQTTSTEKLSIRFTQPDRFSIGDIQKENETTANEESTISIPYVNKGKTTIYNMEARLETDMSSEETYKFMGNVEAGTSGTIDFFVTPHETGNQKAKITVTYEDAEGNEKTAEREVELAVTEGEADMSDYAMSMDGMEEEMEVNKAGFFSGKTMIYGAAAAVLIVIIAVVLRRRKQKKIKLEEEEIL
ncbi:MAG: hypothetical protein Q4D16_05395 [Eubacteriales bacterium]|nr:hypothetical protein [Eubacteriales bacterium]